MSDRELYWHRGQEFDVCVPAGHFLVDGILYDYPLGGSPGPMFSVRHQEAGAKVSTCYSSYPPSDTELDYWVRTGKLLPW